MKRYLSLVLALVMAAAVCLTPALAAEDAEAALEEGMGYWWGYGDNGYDMEKAREAFQKAADLGSAEAWYWLGELAYYGVEEGHIQQALEDYQKAADLGSGCGLYGLGDLYRLGESVTQDYEKALTYYQQAVDAGCPKGNIGLAYLYRDGRGVEADGNKALAYFEAAADSRDWYARNVASVQIGRAYHYGSLGAEKDDAKAREWLLKAADEQYPGAYIHMGYITQNPIDPAEMDIAEAFRWYEKAAAGGNPYNLATCYLDGKGVEIDLARAVELLKQSENGGRDAVSSLSALAYCYLTGSGVAADQAVGLDYANRTFTAAGVKRSEVEPDATSAGVGYLAYLLDYFGL